MKSQRITGWIPPDVKSAAQRAATDLGVSESVVVLWALQRWLESPTPPRSPPCPDTP